MNYWILLMFLVYEAIEDWKHRSVSVTSLIIAGVVGIVGSLFLWEMDILSVVGGMMVGIALIVVGLISMGAFGLGDGAVFLVTGIYLGSVLNLCLMLAAMVVAMIYGLVVLMSKNKTREIPFIPCILLAYMEVMFFAA